MLSGLSFFPLSASRCPLRPARGGGPGSGSGGRSGGVPGLVSRSPLVGVCSVFPSCRSGECWALPCAGAYTRVSTLRVRRRLGRCCFGAGHPQDTAPTDIPPQVGALPQQTPLSQCGPCSAGRRAVLRTPLRASPVSASSQPVWASRGSEPRTSKDRERGLEAENHSSTRAEDIFIERSFKNAPARCRGAAGA